MQKKDAQDTGRMTGGKTRGVFSTIGHFLITCVMVGIITGCIVACVLTVYIFNLMGADNHIDLDQEELGYKSTMVYYNASTDTYDELQKLYLSDNNRIWVAYNDISEHALDAVIAIEDKRFWDHQGVDWRRTIGAFIEQFMPGVSKGGGSTIHQQLIKNVTGDDDLRIDRKVREIFRALQLHKDYSKEQVLEAYLNVVPFGAGTNGIETAALTYFGKHASELDLAESASIVGITKYPTLYNPFRNPEKNKERQEYILTEMLKQGVIDRETYEFAITQELEFKREEYQQENNNTIMSYYEDHVITTVLNDLQEQYDWTPSYAFDQLYRRGYTIYTSVDLEMQNYLEKMFLSSEGFPAVRNAQYPQAAASIIDPNGRLLAVVGGIGEKTHNRAHNRATMSKRQPGSAIKPIGPYALAFEYNYVRWSSMMDDSPIPMPGNPSKLWPVNHYGSYWGRIPVVRAIQQSTNTIPVKLVQMLTPETVFDFMHDRLNMYNLVDDVVINGERKSDISLAPMALGATTGVTPLEMVGAYQIYANGGTFTTPYCYTKVVDAKGTTILETDTSARYVISEDTSVLVNKLLQAVVTGGTGQSANLGNMPTAGKTGTSDSDINQWFIGMTPYYVCQVWMGYDNEYRVNEYGQSVPNSILYNGYVPPQLWKQIMAPLHENLDYKDFPQSETVKSYQYCTVSGNLAGSGCPSASGWFKESDKPTVCTLHGGGSDDAKNADSSVPGRIYIPSDDHDLPMDTMDRITTPSADILD